MRRVLLLLAVAAMMLALPAAPALADAPAPGDVPVQGEPQTPESSAKPTKSAGSNCYGKLNSNNLKGPGGNPGSPAEPTTFDPDAEGPLPEQQDYTGHAVSTLPSGAISDFQLAFRDEAAGESC